MKPVWRGEKEMDDEILPRVNAFSEMFTVAKSIMEMNDIVVCNETTSKLLGQIIATRVHYAAAVARVRELEGELASLKHWKAEQEHHQLCDLGRGIGSVAWNDSIRNDETHNFIGPDCTKKRPVQSAARDNGCGSIVNTNDGAPPRRTWNPEFDF
jgi:hypothetical protein